MPRTNTKKAGAGASTHKKNPSSETAQPRRLKLPAPRMFRLKRITYPEHLPSVWVLTKKTAILLWRQRMLVLGISAIYAVLSLIFVRGFGSGTDIGALKQQFDHLLGGNAGELAVGVSIFTSLLTSSGASVSAAAGAYQFFLMLIISLATIWALRQVMADQRVRLRDAFYKGMYPLVPFVLVLAVIALQAVPFLIGAWLFSTVTNNGIAVHLTEQLAWGALLVILTGITAYMLCSSTLALYIVTLPDMTPLKALRSARQLVAYRRGQVFRKLLYLPVALLVTGAIIMVPVILYVPALAQAVFFVLSMLALVVANTYMYIVYKELLA